MGLSVRPSIYPSRSSVGVDPWWGKGEGHWREGGEKDTMSNSSSEEEEEEEEQKDTLRISRFRSSYLHPPSLARARQSPSLHICFFGFFHCDGDDGRRRK